MQKNKIWDEILRDERTKLIFAYIVFPIVSTLLVIFLTAIPLDTSQIEKLFTNFPFEALFMTDLCFLVPPSIIRFLYSGGGLTYGIKLYLSVVLSVIISIFLMYILVGLLATPGTLSLLSVYFILSYKATGFNMMSKGKRNTLLALTVIVCWVWSGIVYFSIGKSRSPFPVGTILVFYHILNSHLYKPSSESKQQDSSQSNDKDTNSATDNIDDFTNLYTDIANKLIEIGLARIGRKTTEPNEYLNSALDEERKAVERPFLRILANRYRTDEQRKILAKHFMLFKEMCLFISYHAILKDDTELHETVKTKLKRRLTAGMPLNAMSLRNKYWYKLSKKFYEEYSRTQSMPDALTYSFWRTAVEKYPEIVNITDMPEFESREAIFAIFEYSYRAIEAEYKKI